MTRLRTSHALARLVLAWFALFVVLGSVAPSMQAHASDTVCSAAGTAGVPAGPDGPLDGQASSHTIECPLCLPLFAPPAADFDATLAFTPAVDPIPRARPVRHVAFTVAAPLPARGPPSIA